MANGPSHEFPNIVSPSTPPGQPAALQTETFSPTIMQVDPTDLSCSARSTSDTIVDVDLNLDPFTLVQRRKRLRGSIASGDNARTMPEHGLTVIVKPKDAGHLITKINPLKLHEKLDSIYPDGIISARPNPRLNLLALDTRNTEATKAFLALTCIGKIAVQSYEPRSPESSVGVIRGVSTDISDVDLQTAIRGTVPARQVRRLGTSDVVKIIFQTNAPPAYVKIGYTRFPVLSYIEKPPKCSKCCRFGHIESTCVNTARCTRCGSPHDGNACEAEKPRCPNCKQSHDFSSTLCPAYRREKAIYRHKSEHGTGYLVAKTAVLSTKVPATTIAHPNVVAHTNWGPKSVILPSDQSRTDAFPPLVEQCTPKKQEVRLSITKPTTKRCSTEGRPTSNTEHIDALPTFGTTIRKLIDIIRSLLAPLTSPFATAIICLIDTVLPFFASL